MANLPIRKFYICKILNIRTKVYFSQFFVFNLITSCPRFVPTSSRRARSSSAYFKHNYSNAKIKKYRDIPKTRSQKMPWFWEFKDGFLQDLNCVLFTGAYYNTSQVALYNTQHSFLSAPLTSVTPSSQKFAVIFSRSEKIGTTL